MNAEVDIGMISHLSYLQLNKQYASKKITTLVGPGGYASVRPLQQRRKVIVTGIVFFSLQQEIPNPSLTLMYFTFLFTEIFIIVKYLFLQLGTIIAEKLTTSFHGLRHLFRSHDPTGQGNVSR